MRPFCPISRTSTNFSRFWSKPARCGAPSTLRRWKPRCSSTSRAKSPTSCPWCATMPTGSSKKACWRPMSAPPSSWRPTNSPVCTGSTKGRRRKSWKPFTPSWGNSVFPWGAEIPPRPRITPNYWLASRAVPTPSCCRPSCSVPCVRPCTARTTWATSVWPTSPTPTSLPPSGAIRICWCTGLSRPCWPRKSTTRGIGTISACTAPPPNGGPTRPPGMWKTGSSASICRAVWARNLTAPLPGSRALASSSPWTTSMWKGWFTFPNWARTISTSSLPSTRCWGNGPASAIVWGTGCG